MTARWPTDEAGRFVWIVTWGVPGRPQWHAVLVRAHEPDEAISIAREAYPDRLPPDAAVLVSPEAARSVLEGRPDPTVAALRLL